MPSLHYGAGETLGHQPGQLQECIPTKHGASLYFSDETSCKATDKEGKWKTIIGENLERIGEEAKLYDFLRGGP
jgi:hypothetical protein